MSSRRGEGRAPSFRRRLVALRRRRISRLQRFGKPLLRVGLVLAPVALLVAWLLSSPAFALRTVEIDGSERLERSWVEASLEAHFGRNLLRLSLLDVQARLRVHPWVKRVELSKQLPDRLRLAVVEHQPVALLEGAHGLVYLSSEGEVITPYRAATDDAPYLLVRYVDRRQADREGESGPGGRPRPELERVLALARRLAESRTGWAEGLLTVEILAPEDFRLWVRDLPFPILVRSDSTSGGYVAHDAYGASGVRGGSSRGGADSTPGAYGEDRGQDADSADLAQGAYSADLTQGAYSADLAQGAYSADLAQGAYSADLTQGAYSALIRKCAVLDELLPQIVERFGAVEVVDLRFSRRIVIRRGAGRATGEQSSGGAV